MMLQITEDTPPDMLAGAMDLTVHLPTGRAVKISVERSTPMMDLLVQVTTKHHLSLCNYTLQPLQMSSEVSENILPYKPNTPIGTLDTQHVRVVPKSRTLPVPKNIPPGHQPFESTFRLKVHLPRNQLYVTRVSRNILLEDIMKEVCQEKNLNPAKYEFKHPANLDEVLDPKLALSDYQITEIYVVLKGTTNLSQAFSNSDIMVLRKEEERKQMHNKTGGGVFNLIFRRGRSSTGSGSISSDARSISPTRSDDSRSVTPPNSQKISAPSPPKKDPPPERPKPPQRKRRPAPKPPLPEESSSQISVEKPSENLSGDSETQLRQSENGITICHSRNSSDSSGYHEASVLSENCNASLPRRTKSAFITPRDVEKLSKMHSQSTTNLSNMSSHSKSTMSLGVTGRKKRAAPPPPPLIRASNPSIDIETPSPVVASQPVKYSLGSHQTLDSLLANTPYAGSVSEVENNGNKCFGSTDSGIAQETIDKLCHPDEIHSPMTPPPPPLLTDDLLRITDSSVVVSEDISSKFIPKVSIETNIQEVIAQSPKHTNINIVESLDESKLSHSTLQIIDDRKSINLPELAIQESEVNELDWQYQLPSPPKDFRDSSPVNFIGKNNIESHSTFDFKDSVVTSPELFEKLKNIEDLQSEKETVSSEVTSIVSEEDKPLLSTLSLENLEKRRSLVYNRELASLKMTDNIDNNDINNETFSSSLTKFETAYVEMQTSSQQNRTATELKVVRNTSNTLPNFKISTYDRPKQKIKVFEDDTIRSNTDNIPKNKEIDETDTSSTSVLKKSYIGRSMENLPLIMKTIDSNSNFQKEKDGYSEEYVPVSRSDSFSTENVCPPLRPVSRSKSHLTINAYRFKNNSKEDQVSRSNSLYDVSGLQSLGVMRLIQNKLNTPASSTDNLHISTTPKENHQKIHSKEPPKELVPKPIVDKQNNSIPEKIYKYQGPPSINMGTWSERPKVPVTVKEDADYKLGNISSKLIVNTTYNNVTSNNTLEVRRNNYLAGKEDLNDKNKVIDMNSNNNVVIKIGSDHPRLISNQRFFGHTTAMGYRKPLTNINTNRPTQRPHSIAFDSEFDISRVPVVKSVEFKKSFKDNTSVTKINQEDLNVVPDADKFPTINRNNETETSGAANQNGNVNKKELKSVFRTNSLKHHMTPVVRGFHATNNNNNIGNNLYPWNSSNTLTLPSKIKERDNFTTNVHVPFSQSNLRKTESNLIKDRNLYSKQYNEDVSQKIVIDNFHSLPSVNYNTRPNIKPPPPPPFVMPKVALKPIEVKPIEPVMDQRDQLLAAIRTFGGKKGLKSIKAT